MKNGLILKSKTNKRMAFTLAEVLITLGIIGVVAAMTLPTIIANTRKKELHTALNKSYSVLQQGLQKMSVDTGEAIIPQNYPVHKFKPVFMQYFSAAKDCGMGSSELKACVPNMGHHESTSKAYTSYNGEAISLHLFDDGQFITNDGMLILIENVYENIYISVDVNGLKRKPNKWGHDLFTFQLMPDGKLLPMGAEGTYYTTRAFCSKTSTDELNGVGCTYAALTDKNYWSSL